MERLTVSAREAAVEPLRELRFEAREVSVRDLPDDDRVRPAEAWFELWPTLRRRVAVRLLVELDDVRPLLPRCGMPAPSVCMQPLPAGPRAKRVQARVQLRA
jgi:hypothetical protein